VHFFLEWTPFGMRQFVPQRVARKTTRLRRKQSLPFYPTTVSLKITDSFYSPNLEWPRTWHAFLEGTQPCGNKGGA
jgi:hypothetical protein